MQHLRVFYSLVDFNVSVLSDLPIDGWGKIAVAKIVCHKNLVMH
jgi:hypothetical protein